MTKEIYFSTDIEADGPIPGDYSMLSFASVALDETGKELGTFSRNLDLLPNSQVHPRTEAFWKENPVAYAATRVNTVSPAIAMKEYVTWVKSFGHLPVFVAFPAGFDFTFMYWYMIKFSQQSPFSFAALDIKSYAMAKMKTGFRDVKKRNMPKVWFEGLPEHTHIALDDAREQGQLFINIMKS